MLYSSAELLKVPASKQVRPMEKDSASLGLQLGYIFANWISLSSSGARYVGSF